MKLNEEYIRDLSLVESAIPIEQLSGKRICITGATGLIGSAVADILLYLKTRKGLNLEIYLSGRNEEKIAKRFGFWAGSFCFLPYFEINNWNIALDYFVHCAENAHPKVFSENPAETLVSSVEGINSVLRYVHKFGGRLCYLSSSEVYGKTQTDRPICENEMGFVDLSDARSCYPSAKRAAETLCACYLKEYGTYSVIVRPGHIYGAGFTREDSRAFAQFARNVLSGQDIVMKSEGLQIRSYCYALDCASAILSVAVKGRSGEAYNIANPSSNVSIRRLAETFAAVAGRKVVFDLPTQSELNGYNKMTYSALNSDKLLRLGWKGKFDIGKGVESTLKFCEL